MTTVLIDADIVCYRVAAACENETVETAIQQSNDYITKIIQDVQASSYLTFLSGSSNYRYEYNPDYKANRIGKPKPKWLQHLREHLAFYWDASVEETQEADDALGIYQMHNQDTIIASIDKDLLMIPGEHYNFVKNIRQEVHPVEGMRHFYWQLIMGDRADHIFGYDGKARVDVPKFLQPKMEELSSLSDPLDMYELVREMYNDDERLLMNGICLWIRREPDEIWKPPT